VHHATGLGLDLTFRQSNHEGKSPTSTSATNITGIRRFVGRDRRYLRLGPDGYIEAMHALAELAKKSRSEPTRITPNEWASVLSSLLLVHFKVSG
jgi:hypothetical protein